MGSAMFPTYDQLGFEGGVLARIYFNLEPKERTVWREAIKNPEDSKTWRQAMELLQLERFQKLNKVESRNVFILASILKDQEVDIRHALADNDRHKALIEYIEVMDKTEREPNLMTVIRSDFNEFDQSLSLNDRFTAYKKALNGKKMPNLNASETKLTAAKNSALQFSPQTAPNKAANPPPSILTKYSQQRAASASKAVTISLSGTSPVSVRVSFADEKTRDEFLSLLDLFARAKDPSKITENIFKKSANDKRAITIVPYTAENQQLGAYLSNKGEVSINFGDRALRDFFLTVTGIKKSDRCETDSRPKWSEERESVDSYAPTTGQTTTLHFNPYTLPPPYTELLTKKYGKVVLNSVDNGSGPNLQLSFGDAKLKQAFMDNMPGFFEVAPSPPGGPTLNVLNTLKISTKSKDAKVGVFQTVDAKEGDEIIAIQFGNSDLRDTFCRELNIKKSQANALGKDELQFNLSVISPPKAASQYKLQEQNVDLEAGREMLNSLNRTGYKPT